MGDHTTQGQPQKREALFCLFCCSTVFLSSAPGHTHLMESNNNPQGGGGGSGGGGRGGGGGGVCSSSFLSFTLFLTTLCLIFLICAYIPAFKFTIHIAHYIFYTYFINYSSLCFFYTLYNAACVHIVSSFKYLLFNTAWWKRQRRKRRAPHTPL
jgi:hypothetical protein